MCRLAEVPAVIDAIHRHNKSIVQSLSDPDISIRRRALDLLFAMCNSQNVTDIMDELLGYLDVADLSMREELVLKCALLAERYVWCFLLGEGGCVCGGGLWSAVCGCGRVGCVWSVGCGCGRVGCA